jgi:hypothetical protein
MIITLNIHELFANGVKLNVNTLNACHLLLLFDGLAMKSIWYHFKWYPATETELSTMSVLLTAFP